MVVTLPTVIAINSIHVTRPLSMNGVLGHDSAFKCERMYDGTCVSYKLNT